MSSGTVRQRDVFDTRVALERQGGRDVAMDDHGARRTPATWRWSYLGATFTAAGVSTAMIYPLSGALLTIAYGAKPALIAAAITTVYTFAATYYLVRHGINEGISADLLSRSTFGYIGSAFNAALYGTVCGFYFAVEGSVMASALHEIVPAIPYWGWAVATNASFVVIGIFGMILLSKVQWATLVVYFCGLLVAFWALVAGWDDRVTLDRMQGWMSLNPNDVPFDFWTVLEAISSYIGVLGAILAIFTIDVARFIRREERGFGGVFFTAVNTVFPVFFMAATGITMLAASGQPDPGVTVVRLLGTGGLLVTLVTQIRINLLNLYGGTLGLANFFSRVAGFVPGRQFWVAPFLLVATGVILTPFRDYFGQITIYISVFLCAWVSTLIGERLLVRNRHGLPTWSEVRRSYLPDYNVVGLVSMWVPVAMGCVMATGLFGRHVRALAVPFSIVVPFLVPAAVAAALGRERLVRCYVAREVVVPPQEHEVVQCGRCEGEFHRSDFALCPFHDGIWICSYCCMSELQCRTVCRSDGPVVTVPVLDPD